MTIHCPECRKARPTVTMADGPERFAAAWTAYMPCCNPECGGCWGIGCWHCHHPDFIARDLARVVGGRENPFMLEHLDADPNRGAVRLLAWAMISHHDPSLEWHHGHGPIAACMLPIIGGPEADTQLAVLADRLQVEGHPVGEWLALYQAKWLHGEADGIGAAVYWLRGEA